jgi:hypothetical protein
MTQMRNQTEMTELGVIRASVIDRGQGPRLLSLGVIIVPLNNQMDEKQMKKVNVAPRTGLFILANYHENKGRLFSCTERDE